MRILFIICACLCSLFNMQAVELKVVPKPLSVKETGKPDFVLNSKTEVYVTPTSKRIGEMWVESISKSLPFELKVNVVSNVKNKKGIVFDVSGKDDMSEAYTLNIDDKRIILSSKGLPGLLYASKTLSQLMPPEIGGNDKYTEDITIPSLIVNDKPRFKWRGYMQDVSRTFYSTDVLKKYIDIMSLYKMNVLHLHLTDDQGWRVEIKKYPRLTSEKATQYPEQYDQPAGRSGFYTQKELKELIAYAAERNVQIVPEIDIPGHCWPVLITYPELAVNESLYPDYVMPFRETYHVWGHQFTPNTLDPTNEKVYKFLDNVFTEIAEIFPSEYIHFGGDEVRHILWEKNERIQKFMKEKGMNNVMELQSYFVQRVSEIISNKGKKPIGWNDILADADNLPKSTHIMSWLGNSAVKDAAKYGFRTIATPSSHLYFDIRQGTPDDGLLSDLSYPYAITLKDVYGYDPTEGLNKKETECLLGVQANMWPAVPQEVKDINLQNFPRLLALAEIAWAEGEKDFPDFEDRMSSQYKRLDALKVDYYKPDCHIIATWSPDMVKTIDYTTWEFDVTNKVYDNGRAMAGLFYTKGENRLNINKMQLLENGVVIAEDLHRGFADETRATGKRKNYLYYLDVKNYKKNAKYTLRMEVSGYRGTDSYGNVIFSLSPYEPFKSVESDKAGS
ncbi:MAG: beta-N-acetylhexosaminidase [Parabacteroides sp.]|nr:beta-N-acetylhexosaminidase [Parabacteroides sp.]